MRSFLLLVYITFLSDFSNTKIFILQVCKAFVFNLLYCSLNMLFYSKELGNSWTLHKGVAFSFKSYKEQGRAAGQWQLMFFLFSKPLTIQHEITLPYHTQRYIFDYIFPMGFMFSVKVVIGHAKSSFLIDSKSCFYCILCL